MTSSTKTSTVYKIKRSDGMFSLGGSWPSFNKNGKIWKHRGDLTSHLRVVVSGRNNHLYEKCKIIEYELVERAECTDTISIVQWLIDIEERKRKERDERSQRQQQREKRQRQKLYTELHREFGNEPID